MVISPFPAAMTILTPLSAAIPAVSSARPAVPGASPTPPASAPATAVSLGQATPAGAGTYLPSGIVPPAAIAPIWENRSGDPLSSLMAGNLAAGSLAQRFHKLGAALMNTLGEASGDGGGNYSQSVMQFAPGVPQSAAYTAIAQSQLHAQLDNQITLSVKTAGGTLVRLTLGNQSDGLAVQIKVSDGTLTDVERDALTRLSDAFQTAVDGITAGTPHLDVAGLTQFDPTILASVDLHANVNGTGLSGQSIDFHADGMQRTVSTSGPTGSMKLSVDLSHPELLGNAAQRAQAVSRYLEQFDAASRRGQGNADLMAMMKDAFSAMQSAPVAPPPADAPPVALSPDRTDRYLLSGLADFTASVSQASVSNSAPNPLKPKETDGFSFQASQSTQLTGNSRQNRVIRQQQQSHLSASFHRALISGLPLALSTDRQSQNYYYTQLNDEAFSSTDIAYDKGVLIKALLNRTASQSTHVMKYVMGDLVQDTTTPSQASQSTDVLSMLRAIGMPDATATSLAAYRVQQALAAVSKQVLPEADPARLRAAPAEAGLRLPSF